MHEKREASNWAVEFSLSLSCFYAFACFTSKKWDCAVENLVTSHCVTNLFWNLIVLTFQFSPFTFLKKFNVFLYRKKLLLVLCQFFIQQVNIRFCKKQRENSSSPTKSAIFPEVNLFTHKKEKSDLLSNLYFNSAVSSFCVVSRLLQREFVLFWQRLIGKIRVQNVI